MPLFSLYCGTQGGDRFASANSPIRVAREWEGAKQVARSLWSALGMALLCRTCRGIGAFLPVLRRPVWPALTDILAIAGLLSRDLAVSSGSTQRKTDRSYPVCSQIVGLLALAGFAGPSLLRLAAVITSVPDGLSVPPHTPLPALSRLRPGKTVYRLYHQSTAG